MSHRNCPPRGTAAFGERRTSIDELIRPGRRRAYPLPGADESGDEAFRRALEALTQLDRERGKGPTARPEPGEDGP